MDDLLDESTRICIYLVSARENWKESKSAEKFIFNNIGDMLASKGHPIVHFRL